MGMKGLLLGLLFTILYASGAIAMKFGLQSAPPLTLATLRFVIAGIILLTYLYVFQKGKYAVPNKRELWILFWLGLLNTSLFLGLGLIALQTVSSGIFNLFVPANALLFALLAFMFLGQTIRLKEWGGMIISFIGLFIASYPSLVGSHATFGGILLLFCAIISMALGSLIFKKTKISLPPLVINTWQVVFGGLILIIPSIILESGQSITVDLHLIGYLLWSVFALSIFNLSLWFYLLKKDAIIANNWLLLNPVAGYLLAAPLLGEPITKFAVIGTVFVLFGLYMSGNFRIKSPVEMVSSVKEVRHNT
ncbi:DMT family transporter [Lysinibacillus antri]|uniref:EamA/RhaT family transporter n=1 Tax=Lysinibacillus antri TaxID=2498145 RepID=A0A3S0QRC3_9BACI|nr:EamA family transporter [Lysinibacillus antri]RUL55613.1 EamA/RhaT family transporter [Lysinibacillus antri]